MHLRIAETKLHKNISLELDIKSKDEQFVHLIEGKQSTRLKDLVERAKDGMRKGFAPELCVEGVGGTYFFCDSRGHKIGVFKPQDEEPFSINNPKGFSPKSANSEAGFKEGILVGEASLRECAAYLLDHQGFSGVPETELALCQHPAFYSSPVEEIFVSSSPTRLFLSPQLGRKVKLGSFQEFVDHDGDTEDMGTSFLSKFPVEEVHKIAVLDVRLFNEDRHAGNILHREIVKDNGETRFELIPIDHGYTLPSTLGDASFVWMYWPQAKANMSEQTKDYIKSLDAEKDIELLKLKFGRTIREEHFRVLRIATMVLKKSAEEDLTFLQIAQIMCRSSPDEPSVLERLCSQVERTLGRITDDIQFVEHLANLLDTEMRRMARNGPLLDESSDDETCAV